MKPDTFIAVLEEVMSRVEKLDADSKIARQLSPDKEVHIHITKWNSNPDRNRTDCLLHVVSL